MATLGELVDNLGGMVVELISAPRGLDVDLGRVVVHDPLEHLEVGSGDVVLAVGIGTASEMTRLLRAIAAQDAAAVLIKGDPAILAPGDSESGGVAVLAVPAGTPWAQVVLLISSVVASDRFRDGDERFGDASAGDLFSVANAIAESVGAPITIEDPQSIVLAFSGRQDEADAARVATVLGRRVPEMYRRLLTDKGVFKRLYSEPGAVYCELGNDVLPRLAVAVRAGDEVLGSIWAAVQGPVDAERERMLVDAAGFVSLHLLRHQVAADAQRGLETDLMAAVLNGGGLATEASRRLDLTGPGFRVVAVGIGDSQRADRAIQLARCRNLLALQLSAVHRGAPTAQVGGVVYAIVPSLSPKASAAALRQLMEQYVARAAGVVKASVLVGIGPPVDSVTQIPASRSTADKVLRVLKAEPGLTVAEMDEVRASALLMEFAAEHADDPALTGGPIRQLLAHDEEHHTNYTHTVAAYLDAFGDVDEAARMLDVHANTVRYRLRQLHKVVDLHLDDPSHRLALMLQLRLLKAAG